MIIGVQTNNPLWRGVESTKFARKKHIGSTFMGNNWNEIQRDIELKRKLFDFYYAFISSHQCIHLYNGIFERDFELSY